MEHTFVLDIQCSLIVTVDNNSDFRIYNCVISEDTAGFIAGHNHGEGNIFKIAIIIGVYTISNGNSAIGAFSGLFYNGIFHIESYPLWHIYGKNSPSLCFTDTVFDIYNCIVGYKRCPT